MPQATVHLLRHGEVHNPDGVLYGRLPEFHLSELGRQMARMLAEHFSERAAQGAKIVHLAASPLTRAQETAQPDRRGAGPRDRHRGPHHRGRELLRGAPRHQGANSSSPSTGPGCATRSGPSWGEPYKEQAARVIAAVQDARLRAIELGGDGAEAILVSHQLPIWATRLSAEGRPLWHDPRKRECTLTSLTSLVFDDDGTLVRVDYSEPAAALLPGAASTPGA